VECKDSSFPCLLINLSSTEQRLKHFLQTQELPKLSGQYQGVEKRELNKRGQTLQAQLRMAHIKEREEEIRFVPII